MTNFNIAKSPEQVETEERMNEGMTDQVYNVNEIFRNTPKTRGERSMV